MPEYAQKEQREDQPLRRMNSITRKLHHQLFAKKIVMFIAFDLLTLLLVSFGWFIDTELRVIGELRFDVDRSFTSSDGFWGIEYLIREKDGTELLRENASRLIFFLIAIAGTLLFVEIVSVAIRWYGESQKIRKTLRPINEIALKADAISRMTFSDAIYQTEGGADASFQRLEEAIQGLDPEQEQMPSLGDQELQGIEAAMNNLLRRMHESYQQQARFVNDASHELRTPIAVIQGYANMLERWGREDEEVLNESITAITHEADHMHQLVEQLLFLARGDSGRTQLKEEPIDPKAMMEEIYEESLMIDEKHKYRFKSPETLPRVIGDPTLLKQSIRILVDNAAKYTKEGDDIYISTGRTDDGDLYLQVQDTGIGMAEADVQHMFERFYRSDEARDIKGTGLGLAIAKWIVDRHKGHFEILSRTELGTRIRVVLPQSLLVQPAPTVIDGVPEESPEAQERPIVFDDELQSGSEPTGEPEPDSGSVPETVEFEPGEANKEPDSAEPETTPEDESPENSEKQASAGM